MRPIQFLFFFSCQILVAIKCKSQSGAPLPAGCPHALALSPSEPPQVTVELQQQEVVFGETVRFACQARGKPAPSVTWLHNAQPLSPSPRHRLTSRMLRVSNVGPQDEGLYQCMAENGVGSSQASARLVLVSAGKLSWLFTGCKLYSGLFSFHHSCLYFCFRNSLSGEAALHFSESRQGAEGAASREARGQWRHVASGLLRAAGTDPARRGSHHPQPATYGQGRLLRADLEASTRARRSCAGVYG